MKKNRLRELLNSGKPTLGTHVIIPWPGVVEVIGQTGAFDYIEYMGEYSPFNLELLDNFGRAIDAGIQNVLFTDCRSAEEVKECIRLVRPETPEAGGTHGAGMRRNVGYVSYAASKEWVKAMNEVVIAIMIEKKGAIENLEEILDVDGVDMVQFGPADYSISIGKVGERGSPEVQKAHQDMIEMALKKGVAPRVEVATFKQAKAYIEMGVRHFCIGWDLGIIYGWCFEQAKGMQKLLESVQP
jgi:2-keto-3-deoxy-L-rhamnonate aldolase RhmA